MKTKHKNWISKAIKHPGALHRQLGIKAGHKIPAGTLFNAAKKGGVMGSRARLAETLKGFKHKMVEGSKEDKAYDKKRNIKEGSKRDMPMKSKGIKCKTCGKTHSKGVKHKFDLGTIGQGAVNVGNTIGRVAGGIGRAVGNNLPRFGSKSPSTQRPSIAKPIINATPGGNMFAQHAADIKAAMNYKKKGKKAKKHAKR